MNKNNLLSVIIILLSTLLWSCEYDNDDKNFNTLNKPEPPLIGIDFEGITSDIIDINGTTTLKYSIVAPKGSVQKVQMNVADASFFFSDSELTITPNVQDGNIHILQVMVYAKSGSGSFVDEAIGEYSGTTEIKLRYVIPNETN